MVVSSRIIREQLHRKDMMSQLQESGLRIDPAEWEDIAQNGELQYWQDHASSAQSAEERSGHLWQIFGFGKDEFRGKTIVDIGAGPLVRSTWFRGAELIAVDPLIDGYAELEWPFLDRCRATFSSAAEDYVPQLSGRADVVVSLNALDHAHDFARIVRNIADYLRGDGLAFLSFDCHPDEDPLHQMTAEPWECEAAFAEAGLEIRKHTTGLGDWFSGGDDDSEPMPGRRSYGLWDDGTAHNYWLTK